MSPCQYYMRKLPSNILRLAFNEARFNLNYTCHFNAKMNNAKLKLTNEPLMNEFRLIYGRVSAQYDNTRRDDIIYFI